MNARVDLDGVLAELVLNAMGAGAMMAAEKVSRGQVDPAAPLSDIFDDYPRQFLAIRADLTEPIYAAIEGV